MFSFRNSTSADVPLSPNLERNKRGGVEISETSVAGAFKLLSSSKHTISANDLLRKLKLFQPSCTMEDVKFLLGEESFLTEEMLSTMLVDNALHFFDPLAEVMPSLSRGGLAVDEGTLRAQMEGLGLKPFSPLEWRTCVEEADCDKDKQLGLEDVRKAISGHQSVGAAKQKRAR